MNALGIFSFFVAVFLVSCGDDSGDKPQKTTSDPETSRQNEYLLKTCPDAGDCQLSCLDSACFDQCVRDSEPAAVAAFASFVDCARENCPDYTIECMQTVCVLETNACYGDQTQTTPEPGDNCGELAECLGDCPDEACQDACIAPATQSALEKFSAVLSCNKECTDAGGTDCLDTVCQPQLVACANDV